MTIPGRGESVGEAYIRIFADGSGLNRSIRDEFKDNDKLFREQGDRDNKSYRKGFDDRERKNPTWAHLVGEMRKGKGEFDRVGQFLGSETAENFRKSLEKELGDKNISDRIFRNISRDTLASGDIDHFARSFRNLSPEVARAAREIENLRLAEARTKNALRETDDEVKKGVRSFGALEKAMKLIEKTDFGKFFGQGSRNNFINTFGNILGIAARGIAFFAVGTVTELGRVIKAFQSTGKEGDNFLKRISSVFGSGLSAALNGLGAISAGVLALPVVFKLALAGVQVFIGPLVALIADLSAVIVALSATIGFGLVGAIAPLLPLLGPLIFGFAAVAIALKGMTGNSKKAAAEIKKYFAPVITQFKALQAQVREGLFGKNNSNAKALSAALVPVLKLLTPLLKNTAGAIGKSLVAFTKALSGANGKSFLQAFTAFNPVAINKLGVAFTHVFLGIGGVLRNLVPFAEALLNSIDKSAISFDRFTNSKSGQEKMTRFFTGAVKSASLLWTFLKNVGKVLYDILSAGKNTGDTLFGNINKALETYDKYLSSPRGKAALQSFFAQVKPFLGALGTLVGGLGQLFKSLNNGQSQNILFAILKGLGGLFSIIAKNVPSIIPILRDFAGGMTIVFGVLSTVVGFIGQHEDIFRPIIVSLGALYIASKLLGAKTLTSLVSTIGRQVSLIGLALITNSAGALTGVQRLKGAVTGLGIAAAGLLAGFTISGATGAALGIGGGLIGGALFGGSVGGVPGAVIGGVIGGIAGAVSHFWGNATRDAEKAKAQQVAYLQAITDAADTLISSISGIGQAYTDAARAQVIANLSVNPKGGGKSIVQIAQDLGVDTKQLADAVGGNQQALQQIQFAVQSAEAAAQQNIARIQAKLDADRIAARGKGTGTPEGAAFAADQKALDKARAAAAAQQQQLNDLLAKLGIEGAAVAKDIKLKDDQAAAEGKLNLATRDVTSQILTYTTVLTGSSVAAQRNIQFIKDHTTAIAKSKPVQDALKKSVKDGALAWIDQTKSLEASLVAAGFAKPVVDGLIAKYDTIPKNIRTAIIADASKLPPAVQLALANLGLIPPTKSTKLLADNATAAGLAAANYAVKRWQEQNHQVTLTIVPVISDRLLVNQLNNIRSQLRDLKLTAAGGRFNGAQARIIGEAGPEAVVPLRRPLSQVDPSVRALSAYAQGIPYGGAKQMASGGVVAPSSPAILIGEGGALFATSTTDPQAVVSELLARAALKVGG